MASGNEEKKSSSKLQQKRVLPTSKVKSDLDGSQHIDDANQSLDEVDEFLEFSPLSNNPSSSSNDSTTNGTTTLQRKTLSNNENKSTAKRCLRKMSGITMGSSISLRPTNITTPKELCDLFGGSRVINKV